MQFGQGTLWMTVVCGFLAAAQTQETGSVSVSTSIQVTSEALAAQPVGANWLSYNGDYTGRRFGSLEQMAQSGMRYLGSDTTRIFCLPTCRHARRITLRHRVSFPSEMGAHEAGYRACKVCRPAVAA